MYERIMAAFTVLVNESLDEKVRPGHNGSVDNNVTTTPKTTSNLSIKYALLGGKANSAMKRLVSTRECYIASVASEM
jgi:hypothetical protein